MTESVNAALGVLPTAVGTIRAPLCSQRPSPTRPRGPDPTVRPSPSCKLSRHAPTHDSRAAGDLSTMQRRTLRQELHRPKQALTAAGIPSAAKVKGAITGGMIQAT